MTAHCGIVSPSSASVEEADRAVLSDIAGEGYKIKGGEALPSNNGVGSSSTTSSRRPSFRRPSFRRRSGISRRSSLLSTGNDENATEDDNDKDGSFSSLSGSFRQLLRTASSRLSVTGNEEEDTESSKKFDDFGNPIPQLQQRRRSSRRRLSAGIGRRRSSTMMTKCDSVEDVLKKYPEEEFQFVERAAHPLMSMSMSTKHVELDGEQNAQHIGLCLED